MILRRLILLLYIQALGTFSYAYDFKVDGIYYNILDMAERTVEVTHSGIPKYVFRVYWKLNGTTHEGELNSYDSNYTGEVIIPSEVTFKEQTFKVVKIGEYAFTGQYITCITIPSSITEISYCKWEPIGYSYNHDAGPFTGCNQLTKIKLGCASQLSYFNCTDDFSDYWIGSTTIYTQILKKIESITFLEDFVGNIGNDFSIFEKLSSIISYSKNPPIFNGANQFTKSQLINLSVCVPEDAFEAYSQADVWKNFWKINPMIMAKNIQISESLKEVSPNSSFRLYAQIIPEDVFDNSINWSNNNCEVANVDKEGNVMTFAKGDAVISAIAADGSGVSASCSIHVVDLSNSVKISYSDSILNITCDEPAATIYYTTDGSNPTTSSIKYEQPVKLLRNCTIKAFATYKDFRPSEVVSYTITGFKVEKPVINFDKSMFVMTTNTSDAAIHYTVDGSTPSKISEKYTEPIFIDNSCTIKAVAIRDGWNDSDIASYEFDADAVRCSTPQIRLENNTLIVNCSTEDAVLHYTIDGTKPTAEATVYTTPIEIQHNMVVNVVAMKKDWLNSTMATYIVDWYKVATPKFVYDNGMLSISVDTPEAIIHYTKDGTTPTESSEVYTKPIEIVNNSTIKAIGFLEYYNPSDIATYSVNSFVCNPASIAYNGHYATLETSTEESEIYYTIDGSKPTKSSSKYTGSFDVKGLTTVRAIVVRPNYNDSEEASYAVSYYYDGETASLGESGNITKAFEWCGTDGIMSLSVNGKIDGGDISYVASLPNLRYLKLEDADVVGNSIASNAFANSKLVCVNLPKTLSSIGTNIFIGCDNLAAIVWNANISLPSNALAGLSNPNLLLYVRLNSYAPSSVKNVIVNDYAESIVLTDGDGNTNFYCPRPFTAKSISYRHNYSMKTQIGTCQGWETIALPFDVQTITHSKNGEIAPFAANNATAKPFWMYSLGDYGFEMADKIKANIPYIISMPNNEEYADEYILGGDVTFSAESVKVPVTEQKVLSKGEFLFIPTTVKVAQNSNVYVINKNEEYSGQLPGSMFVPDLRSVSPFEGYLALASETNRPAMVRLRDIGFDDDISGIVNLKKQSGLQIWGAAGSIHIRTDRERTVTVYSVSGSLVRTVDLNVGENVINGFDAGVYIVEHTPVFVK